MLLEAAAHRLRQFRHGGFDRRNHFARDRQRQQIGVGKIAIVHRIFLAAHGAGLVAVRVVQTRLLHHAAAVFDQINLPPHFKLNRLFHEAERVQILDLAAGAECFLAERAHRHIGITAERAFLHVAIANAEPGDERMQGLGIGHRLGSRAHHRLGDDFKQRCAGPVEVDATHAHTVYPVRVQPFVQ